MNFEYFKVTTSMDSINVEDIGNVCIQCNNDDCEEWFLSIETKLGWTEIKEFGPLKKDKNVVDFFFNLYYNKFEFNERKLIKIIDNFINSSKRNITCVDIISEDYFKEKLRGIKNVW